MATPPFSLQTTLPGDSDIVSQFPINERSTRDIIQSWLLVNHDDNGDHPIVTMPWQSSTPTTPAASETLVFATASGRLQIVYPDGSVGFVGLPPSSVIYLASSTTPVGYLVADGSAVSRTTYAELFTAIGTTFGPGDGSTSFNLPDIAGRVIAGEVGSPGRLSTATMTTLLIGGTSLNTGNDRHLMIKTDLPNIVIPYSGSSAITSSSVLQGTGSYSTAVVAGGGATVFIGAPANVFPTGTSSGNTASLNGNVTQTGLDIVQPTIILRALIKV